MNANPRSFLAAALGLEPVPAHLYEVKAGSKVNSKFSENEKATTFITAEQKKSITEEIKNQLMAGNEMVSGIRASLLAKGLICAVRNDNNLPFISVFALPKYVKNACKELGIPYESGPQKILRLFDSGKSRVEIMNLTGYHYNHVHQTIINSGRVIKKDPSKVGDHVTTSFAFAQARQIVDRCFKDRKDATETIIALNDAGIQVTSRYVTDRLNVLRRKNGSGESTNHNMPNSEKST